MTHVRKKNTVLLAIISFVFCSFSMSVAQSKPKTTFKSSDPTTITSNLLSLQSKDRTFHYSGNVVVVQGDMKLTCDQLSGTYTEKNEIQAMTAKSNVVIVKGEEIRALSERADYDPQTSIVILKENPRLIRGGSELQSDVIRVYLDTEKTVAEGQVQMKILDDKSLNQAAPKVTPSPSTIKK
jgi:lipopolysaccharide export system protein LptA